MKCLKKRGYHLGTYISSWYIEVIEYSARVHMAKDAVFIRPSEAYIF